MSIFTTFILVFVLSLEAAIALKISPPKTSSSPFHQISPEGDEKDTNYWVSLNGRILEEKIQFLRDYFGSSSGGKVAKNVILFIGDGMGLSTITAGRIYKGQKDGIGRKAPQSSLSFDSFPFSSLIKVFSLTHQVGESAGGASTLMTGAKVNSETLGVSGRVDLDDCISSLEPNNRIPSFIQLAQDSGKSTGIVTTTRITHATPAAAYAHTANRNWESDSNGTQCLDIARQMIFGKTGRNLRVILGGGRKEFLPERNGFSRKDQRNLLNEWVEQAGLDHLKAKYVQTRNQLLSVNPHRIDYLLGLFNDDHLAYSLENMKQEPTLSEMTKKALDILKKNPNGYFLMVEGGRIDHAHHQNFARMALEEMYQFDKAIQLAKEETSLDDTLIIVTADHGHPLTINGYPLRGNDILGLSSGEFNNFTTLLYGSGPGESDDSKVLGVDTKDINYKYDSAVYLGNSNHDGTDVPLYASGPGSHVFTGTLDQSFIMNGISYATCIGYQAHLCPAYNVA